MYPHYLSSYCNFRRNIKAKFNDCKEFLACSAVIPFKSGTYFIVFSASAVYKQTIDPDCNDVPDLGYCETTVVDELLEEVFNTTLKPEASNIFLASVEDFEVTSGNIVDESLFELEEEDVDVIPK